MSSLSIALFAKHFEDPIEKVLVNQTGALANSFVNAERADNYGVELELRKSLDFVAPGLAPLSVFANTTLMQSKITPGQHRYQRTHQHGPSHGRPGRVRGERGSYATRPPAGSVRPPSTTW